jgi:hypothetical protein
MFTFGGEKGELLINEDEEQKLLWQELEDLAE